MRLRGLAFGIGALVIAIGACGTDESGLLSQSGSGGADAAVDAKDGAQGGTGGLATGGSGGANGGSGGIAGSAGQGGSSGNGGGAGQGGAPQTGGSAGQGGTPQTGGSAGQGGTPQTGGSAGQGGTPQTGGSAGQGGAPQTGGSAGQAGSGGTPNCPSDKPTVCGEECVDITNNAAHCGACSHNCGAGLICRSSACLVGACVTAEDCNDGLQCTNDVCSSGKCYHDPGVCPVGQTCVPTKGCMPSTACANNQDCADTDACTVAAHCDTSTATCGWRMLDMDGDGHVPLICGGDDCNDSRSGTFPGMTESCNGFDDDCDGAVDEGVTCGGSLTCCEGACVNTSTNSYHCGGCATKCQSNSYCSAGTCQLAGSGGSGGGSGGGGGSSGSGYYGLMLGWPGAYDDAASSCKWYQLFVFGACFP